METSCTQKKSLLSTAMARESTSVTSCLVDHGSDTAADSVVTMSSRNEQFPAKKKKTCGRPKGRKNKRKSPPPYQFTCNLCNRQCPTKSGIMQHMGKLHTEYGHVPRDQLYTSTLNSDASTFPKEYPFACNNCQVRSSTKRGIMIHVSRTHCLKTRQFICCVCSRTFSSYSASQTHDCIPLYRVILGDIPCPYCELVFKEKSNLKYHIKYIHKQRLDHSSGDNTPDFQSHSEGESLHMSAQGGSSSVASENSNSTSPEKSKGCQLSSPVSSPPEKRSSKVISLSKHRSSQTPSPYHSTTTHHANSSLLDSTSNDSDSSLSDFALQLDLDTDIDSESDLDICSSDIKHNSQASPVFQLQYSVQVPLEHNYGNLEATPIPEEKPEWPMEGLQLLLQVHREHSYASERENAVQRLSTSSYDDTPERVGNLASAWKPPHLLSRQPLSIGRNPDNGRIFWVYS